jgi:hypothetical protein
MRYSPHSSLRISTSRAVSPAGRSGRRALSWPAARSTTSTASPSSPPSRALVRSSSAAPAAGSAARWGRGSSKAALELGREREPCRRHDPGLPEALYRDLVRLRRVGDGGGSGPWDCCHCVSVNSWRPPPSSTTVRASPGRWQDSVSAGAGSRPNRGRAGASRSSAVAGASRRRPSWRRAAHMRRYRSRPGPVRRR